MQSKKIEQKVVSQEIAIDTYLSKLLDEIPSDNILEQQITETLLTQTLELRKQADKLKLDDKLSVSNKLIDKATKHIKQETEVVKLVKPLAVMPEWTQNEFQALFFKVDKIILAAPLTELLKTIKIETLPTNIPGQPSWFMGLLDVREKRIGVLDTGQLIFGKSRGQQRDLKKQPFKSILITYDGNWGLACDEILSIGRLQPDQVRWRTLRNKRPWLVGTVIEELTAVIDVNQLVPRRKSG